MFYFTKDSSSPLSVRTEWNHLKLTMRQPVSDSGDHYNSLSVFLLLCLLLVLFNRAARELFLKTCIRSSHLLCSIRQWLPFAISYIPKSSAWPTRPCDQDPVYFPHFTSCHSAPCISCSRSIAFFLPPQHDKFIATAGTLHLQLSLPGIPTPR